MGSECERILLSWPEVFQAGSGKAGGKGWNIGRLARYGFNVPRGGVLSIRAYQDFIQDNSLKETTVNILQGESVEELGAQERERELLEIRKKIETGHIPLRIQKELFTWLKNTGLLDKPLAIRSSATAEDGSRTSFAGIYESFLNVNGEDNILSAIKGCYASLWTPRAVAYRRKMQVNDNELYMAVVIMEMVNAKAAGIGFTCDPRTGREDIIHISANFGLGESVVSGAVEPDEYKVNYIQEIIHKTIGRKEGKTVVRSIGGTEFVKTDNKSYSQVLTDKEICDLGLLIQRIFDSLGCGEQHQDIEWVFDGENVVLVQARPVTALPRYTLTGIKNKPNIWSNANFKDAIPMVQSTLNWHILKQCLLDCFFDTLFKTMGYKIPPGLQYVRLYKGRAYINMSILQWGFYDGLGIAPRDINGAFGGHQPEIEISEKKPYAGINGFKRVARLLKVSFTHYRIKKNAKTLFDNVDAFTDALLKEKVSLLDDQGLLNKFTQISNEERRYIPVFSVSTDAGSMMFFEKTLERSFPGKGKAVANALMAGSGSITSAQHGYDLIEMAEVARGDTAARNFLDGEPLNLFSWDKELPDSSPFKRYFRKFMERYGHRGVYEADLSNPRWREDPTYLFNIIKSSIDTADLEKIHEQQKAKVGEAWQEIKQRVPFYRRALINYLLKLVLKDSAFREMCKSELVKLLGARRIIIQEVGRRLAERGIILSPSDIYHCAWSEIYSILNRSWGGGGLDVLVAERKIRQKEMAEHLPPDTIIDEVPCFAEPIVGATGDVLMGVGVASGRASGEAKLIFDPNEGGGLRSGDVLVAPSTDPAWTPLFLKVAAIVMQTGAPFSHGSIVAREYGVPAVVNVPGVMKIIKDGQAITVDGDKGEIYL